jgi:seryl-tRNA synthetase
MTAVVADLRSIGLCWHPSGQAGLRGPLLALADSCDRAFLSLAAIWNASKERHPASLPAAALQRVDYLHSFPHQASLSARLDPAGLGDFLSGEVLGEHGEIAVPALSPITEVLTPAACYHLYNSREGESLDRPLYLTTRNTCFRHESHYEPLRRLWSFSMREVVCLGTKAETVAFVELAREAADEFLRLMDLPVEWLTATDPFFQPQSNPKYLFQRLQPVKHEATYGGDLAIASLNRHHDHFGTAFAITRDGAPAHSACLAFGLERWLFAITHRYGTDPRSWPDPEEAAQKVRAHQ